MFILRLKNCVLNEFQMMKNYDQSLEINHNPDLPYIPDHPYRILIIEDQKKPICY